jgi:hypothetical protein
MRFIELEPGVSVKAEDISVIKDSRSGSTVYTQAGAFESMMILSKHEDRMDSIQKTLANLSKNS